MPSISWWRSAITAIINCKRWISTAEVFLQRKLKKFRLSASERKSRHLMNIFKCVSLSRRICFCPLSMRVGSAFQFGFLKSKPCFLLKNWPWNFLGTHVTPRTTQYQLGTFPTDGSKKANPRKLFDFYLLFHPADNIMSIMLPIQFRTPPDHGLNLRGWCLIDCLLLQDGVVQIP